ncbi:prepilin-type N-terminal cleavage/methylation domain-containing protein [Oceanobacillus halophilus]|uniref:Prepilin-type N-terminal cleavage/methylation domain-containing protein n=1 Tax=Oceanobacillus halophilus TaxID=930130 RepID=A0A495A419_9BACI|nr:prepilin-type N-terminal cleavage/methylation domain-containing protein [Oceanobacillus halophilus]RKQ34286.1 prepilin-type N-terminal cleavage/methylation domain-containing protein [Oceanobacillus halophilus]
MMNSTRLGKWFNDRGFTLIEVLAVLVILSIILLIAVPTFTASIAKANAEVCHANVEELERAYERYLVLEQLDHEEHFFTDFSMEFADTICPEDGIVSYFEGEVNCDKHSVEDDHDYEDEEDEVPYL